MKLGSVGRGKVKIREVKSERLVELGFVPGREVEVLVNRKGRLIVVIKGEKFAISKELAEAIEVD